MTLPPLTVEELDAAAAAIDRWASGLVADNPVVAAAERDPRARRWYVRVIGEAKDVFTLRFQLGQRTLHYETQLLPAPAEQHARFYEYLLRRNHELYGTAFEIGEEDGIFLSGRLDARWVDDDELDRILGSTYVVVERCFPQALRIGFASQLSQ